MWASIWNNFTMQQISKKLSQKLNTIQISRDITSQIASHHIDTQKGQKEK